MFEKIDRGNRRGFVNALLLGIACGCCSSTALAADRVWVGPLGIPPGDGFSFNDPLNWSPNGVPNSVDAAIFDGIGGNIAGSVIFDSALTNNRRLIARGGTPPILLLLQGNVYFLNAPDTTGADRPFVLAPNDSDSVDVQVLDGTLIAGDAAVAMGPNSQAAFRVLLGATVIFFGESAYGEEGQAWVEIFDASTLVNTADATVARNAGSSAQIDIEGAGSVWSIAGTLRVGGSVDGDGGTASIDLTDGASLSVGEDLILHPDASIALTASSGDAATLTATSATLTLDGDSDFSIAAGAASARNGLAIGDGADGIVSLVDESRLSAGAVFLGSSADLSLDGSRVEGDSLEIDPLALLSATYRPGSKVPGEEALFAATNTASLSGSLALSSQTTPPVFGDSIDLVRADTVDGSFLVTTTFLLGGLQYIDISSVERSGETRIVAEVKELDLRLEIDEPTNSPLPAPPNLLTVGSFGEDKTLLDAAVTIPGATRRDPASLVILGNTLPSPGGTPGYAETTTIPVGADPRGLDNGDLFGNARNDIVVASKGTGQVTIVRNNGPTLKGTPFEIAQIVELGGDPGALGIADFDGINGPDIVVAQESKGGFAVLFNDGNGFFTATSTVPSGSGTQGVDPTDLDDDKDVDVIAMNAGSKSEPDSATITVHLNLLVESRGFDGFAPPVSYSIGPRPVALASGDLNGDAFPEIVTANAGDGTLSLLVNRGDGTFELAVSLDALGTPSAIALADLDNDVAADLDIAVLVDNAGVTELTVFRNDTTAGILVLVPIADAQTVFGIPAALASGNADSDGPADLVLAGEGEEGGLAFGATSGAITVHVSEPIQCVGSINGDDEVDGMDLTFVLVSWGPNPGSPADLDGSGTVDGADVAILLANWGSCS